MMTRYDPVPARIEWKCDGCGREVTSFEPVDRMPAGWHNIGGSRIGVDACATCTHKVIENIMDIAKRYA